jgi:hypothetical protein
LTQRLAKFPPGSMATISIVRRDGTSTFNVTLAADPEHGWRLRTSPGATRAQSQHLDAWIR